jgi:enamine deaminase RidA (YjgF/YER057c/UK114 family)
MLVADVEALQVDLLNPNGDEAEGGPVKAAIQLATQRFREQMEKARFSVRCVRSAHLNVTRLAAPQRGAVNGRICDGYSVRFLAGAVSDYGKTYESERTIFVAPHNARIERRSTRAV